MSKVKQYYSLTKPHVTYGNVLTTVAGFLFAAGYFHHFRIWVFLATIAGTTLVIASACVLNNFLDQDIDRIMERTKTRAVASGEISGKNAVIFSITLGIIGMLMLILWVNWLVVTIGVVGYVTYVWLYGALSKRRSIHGTLVGSISGAMPILAGYTAVSGRIDTAAILAFLMLFFWQFPEFYSIAIYRKNEYKAAKVPVMSVVKGVKSTQVQILIYTILFLICAVLLSVFGYTGYTYRIVMLIAGTYWVLLAGQGIKHAFDNQKTDKWARKMFHASLVMLIILSIALSLGAILI